MGDAFISVCWEEGGSGTSSLLVMVLGAAGADTGFRKGGGPGNC